MPQEKPPIHTRPLFTLQNEWLYKKGSTVHVDILFSPIIFPEIFKKNSDEINYKAIQNTNDRKKRKLKQVIYQTSCIREIQPPRQLSYM